MNNIDHLPAVKQGLWFYGGLTACPVRIVRHDTLCGTHDPEDPAELATDRMADCFYISATNRLGCTRTGTMAAWP